MCQVQGVNALGSILARILTRYENWKTDEEYAHHLTMKDVIFQLINTFLPQFWVAFIEPMNYDKDKMCPGDPKGKHNCKRELFVQIGVLFAGQALYSLAKQALLPIVLRFLSQRRIQRLGCENNLGGKEGEADEDWRTEARKDFVELTEYDNIEGPIEDYVELTLQFGYVTMFTAVYPFAPLISFAFNTLQIWMDGHKLLKLHRRPLPLEVKNIGIWEDIFQILSKIGCVTNVALCFFVVDISPIFLGSRYQEGGDLDHQAVKWKLGFFLAFSVGFLLLTTVIEQLLTPTSTAVRVQRARQTIYQQCVLGDRETSAFVNEADAAPDDNSNLASGGHDDSFDIMAALRGG
jgi:anoctamin-10